MNNDKMREEFEIAAKTAQGLDVTRLPHGGYRSFATHQAWWAWQASCAAHAVQEEPVAWQVINIKYPKVEPATHNRYPDWAEGDQDLKIIPLYATPQFAEQQREPCHECGGNGAGGEHEEDCSQQSPSSYPVSGNVFFRDSTDEWVLEITASINGTEITARHTQPAETRPEDVVGLPALYESTPDISELVEALEQIERWDGFPSTNKTWEGSGEPVSYGAAFGSNGERDFMRGVARKALAAYRKGVES